MAGLFDRIAPGAEDRVQVHHLVAALNYFAAGLRTSQAILAAINSLLATPLDGAAQADLSAIATVITGKNTINRLVYSMVFEAACIAVEAGVLAEAGWRSDLEIS